MVINGNENSPNASKKFQIYIKILYFYIKLLNSILY